jgi:hypothetical protein
MGEFGFRCGWFHGGVPPPVSSDLPGGTPGKVAGETPALLFITGPAVPAAPAAKSGCGFRRAGATADRDC